MKTHVLIVHGPPAAGKSTFVRDVLRGYPEIQALAFEGGKTPDLAARFAAYRRTVAAACDAGRPFVWETTNQDVSPLPCGWGPPQLDFLAVIIRTAWCRICARLVERGGHSDLDSVQRLWYAGLDFERRARIGTVIVDATPEDGHPCGFDPVAARVLARARKIDPGVSWESGVRAAQQWLGIAPV